MRKLLLLNALTLLFAFAYSQTRNISGKISDASNKEMLIGATISVKGTTTGVQTDENGKFKFEIPTTAKTLVVSYVGYEPKEIQVGSGTVYNVTLEPSFFGGSDVVVTSSRVSETLKESAIQIEKMTAREIKNSASGDFYQSLGNFKGIDIVNSSAGFKVINLRGFSDTRSLRVKQYIDGVDNESPGLNFPVSNIAGANDLDLESIEVISGAASALYGANAMQGVISMKTKDPFDHQGIAFQLKGGYKTVPGGYVDAQFRYAQVLDKKERLAIKISGSYTREKEWLATDSAYNTYVSRDTLGNPVVVDVSKILRQKALEDYGPGTDITQEDHETFVKLGNWLDFNPWASPSTIKIKMPGYLEPKLITPNAQSFKLNAELHYKFKKDIQLSLAYRFGYGTAIYQSAARYQIKDFTLHNIKAEVKGKNFSVKTYVTTEDAGNSYNLNLTGAYINRSNIAEDYVPDYIEKYFDVLDTLSDGFCADCVSERNQPQYAANARHQAQAAALKSWYQKGDHKFDSLFNTYTQDPDSKTGTKFFDRSTMFHLEGQYQFDFIKAVDLIAGASYRLYVPNSRGTIFEDTAGRKIRVQEVGGFIQASKKLAKDKLRIIGSVRLDKNSNFPVQFSPRLSFVITPNSDHTIRINASRAFRIPTLQEQYLYLGIGNSRLVGNLHGYGVQYTQKSITTLDSLIRNNVYTVEQIETNMPNLVQTVDIKPLKTELVTTVDIGYRGEFLKKRLFLDFTAYFSYYERFLGFTRIASPVLGQAGTESALNQIYASLAKSSDTVYYQPLQLYANLNKPVPSWGANISLSYYAGKGISVYANYTYADLYDKPLLESGVLQLTGFNTPKHKVNIGVMASKVWQGLGFAANFKWVPDYEWQAPMGDGTIKSYTTLDLSISYELEKIYSTFRIGGSNIYNKKYQTAIASPYIGALYYAGWTFDMVNFGNKGSKNEAKTDF